MIRILTGHLQQTSLETREAAVIWKGDYLDLTYLESIK